MSKEETGTNVPEDNTQNQTPEDENTLPQVLDADDAELEAALKAAEEEEKAQQKQEDTKEDDASVEGEEEEKTEEGEEEDSSSQEEPKEQQQPMIPKARLDAVLSELSKARQKATYLEGVAQTQSAMLRDGKGGEEQGSQDQSKSEDTDYKALIEAKQKEIMALSKKYEEGETDYSEAEAAKLSIMNEITDIRLAQQSAQLEKVFEEKTKTDLERIRKDSMQITLDEHAKKLNTEHPHMDLISDEAHWAFLRGEASRLLSEEGVKLDPQSPRSQMLFREKMAELSDTYVPIWTGQPIQKNDDTAPTKKEDDQKKTNVKQREQKIALSMQQPPESSKLGRSGETKQYTEADILKMTDDEIANLPEAIRKKHM